MIRNSFIFLDGLGGKGEKNIWHQGISDWDIFLNADDVKGISQKRKLYFDRKIKEAKKALYSMNANYFVDRLCSVEMWRLFRFFSEDCLFLDIEIASRSDITVIGVYDGIDAKVMVKGFNLDRRLLLQVIHSKKVLVTFNGSSFDIPVLEKYFGCSLRMPHIDLKHLCARLGLIGGLKEVERILGIHRPKHLVGSAVDAWRAYLASGDKEYLQLLVEYNEYDCMNLLPTLNYCYDKLEKALKTEGSA